MGMEQNAVIKFENLRYARDENKNKKVINILGINEYNTEELRKNLTKGMDILLNKYDAKKHSNIIKECFELSCYILYDRQIMDEIIEKQKKFEIDYIVDFFRYILKMFFRRYDEEYILTKNQCIDIKKLCLNILKVTDYNEKYVELVRRNSSRELIKYLYMDKM